MKTMIMWVDRHFSLFLTLTAIATVCDLVMLGIRYCLTKSEWANWVQALGSIAAIFGAFWIGKHQADVQRDLSERARRDVLSDRHSTIKGVLDRAIRYCVNLEKQIADPMLTERPHQVFRYIKSTSPPVQHLMDNIPIYELGSGDLVHAVLNLNSAIQEIFTIAEWSLREISGPKEGIPLPPGMALRWIKVQLDIALAAYNAAVKVTGGEERSFPSI